MLANCLVFGIQVNELRCPITLVKFNRNKGWTIFICFWATCPTQGCDCNRVSQAGQTSFYTVTSSSFSWVFPKIPNPVGKCNSSIVHQGLSHKSVIHKTFVKKSGQEADQLPEPHLLVPANEKDQRRNTKVQIFIQAVDEMGFFGLVVSFELQ